MDLGDDDLRAGLHRAKAVLNWRGIPEHHPVREHACRFRDIVSTLEHSFSIASRWQIDALAAAKDCVSRAMPDILREHSADELLAREIDLLNTLSETAKLHVEVWSSLRAELARVSAILADATPRQARGIHKLSTVRHRPGASPRRRPPPPGERD